MDALLERLVSVLDELTALEDPHLADDELVVGFSTQLSRLEAVVSRQAAAFGGSAVWVDAGAQNPSVWITNRCRIERNRARRRVRIGKALRAMDAVDASFAAGHITIEHVEVLAKARDRSKATAMAFGRDQATLVEWAERLAFHRFKKRVDEWLLAVDEDTAEAHAQEVHDQRRVHLSQSYEDTWFLDGVLDPIAGEIVAETLKDITDELFEADWTEATAALDGAKPTRDQLAALTRTPAQRRADALVEMATRARSVPAGARRPKPLFTVLVGEEAFARTIELALGGATTPGQLARWLDDGLVERVVFDGPARVLEVGEQRDFRGALRRAIEVRDRHCPCGCDRPAARCEVDHITPVSNGGATTQDNGRLFCPTAHRRHHAENHPGFREARAR